MKRLLFKSLSLILCVGILFSLTACGGCKSPTNAKPSVIPTVTPGDAPSVAPSVSVAPTTVPTASPTVLPTVVPTVPQKPGFQALRKVFLRRSANTASVSRFSLRI